MADTGEFSAIFTLLRRINLTEYASKFKEKSISRVLTLRRLTAPEWVDLVPNEVHRNQIIEELNRGENRYGNKQGDRFSHGNTNYSNSYSESPQDGNENQFGGPSKWKNNRHNDYRNSTPNQHNKFQMNNGQNDGYDYSNNPNNTNSNYTFNRQEEQRPMRRGGGGGFNGYRQGFNYNPNDKNNHNHHYPQFSNDATEDDDGFHKKNNYSHHPNDQKFNRICRNFFSEEGCKYDNCRYSHEESESGSGYPLSCERVLEHELVLHETYAHSAEVTLPSWRLKFLIGSHGRQLTEITKKYGVKADSLSHIAGIDSPTISFRIYGKSEELVESARAEMTARCGLVNEGKRKKRFNYILHELELNTRACKLLCAANTCNEGTERYLSDRVLRNIISTFRFAPHQQIQHFVVRVTAGEGEKFKMLTKLVAQMDAVQAIIFCNANRVSSMCKNAPRLSRSMNGATPIFVCPEMKKEERMQGLDDFKRGVANERGAVQRLLITTDDFAKLARKVEIPYVNFVVHLSPPRSEEMYALESCVVGRHNTLGASIFFVSGDKDASQLVELQKTIDFIELGDESLFCETARNFTYEMSDKQLTRQSAYPPDNWREETTSG